jgi:hypothetical protein
MEKNLRGVSCTERDENDAWRGEGGGETVSILGGWHCELGHDVSRMRTQGWPCASSMPGTSCSGKACGGGQIA